MAKAFAIVGIMTSIVQLIDFSLRVLDCLNKFQSSLEEIPKSFHYIKAELPVLQNTLQQTKEVIDAGVIRDKMKRALIPAIKGCRKQIGLLNVILAKMLPTPSNSQLKRGTKTIWSLH